jgi:hypothetical protein
MEISKHVQSGIDTARRKHLESGKPVYWMDRCRFNGTWYRRSASGSAVTVRMVGTALISPLPHF